MRVVMLAEPDKVPKVRIKELTSSTGAHLTLGMGAKPGQYAIVVILMRNVVRVRDNFIHGIEFELSRRSET